MTIPDDGAWLGSGVGRPAPGELEVNCSESWHDGETVVVRRLVRIAAAGWLMNPDVDSHRDDPTPLHELPDGTPLTYRTRMSLTCACGLNLPLEGNRQAIEVLDHLVDNGVAVIGLRRLCGLVSNWR